MQYKKLTSPNQKKFKKRHLAVIPLQGNTALSKNRQGDPSEEVGK